MLIGGILIIVGLILVIIGLVVAGTLTTLLWVGIAVGIVGLVFVLVERVPRRRVNR